MEWGTDPRKRKREAKGRKADIGVDMRTRRKRRKVGNMEMFEQKKRDRRKRGKEIERKSCC